MATARASERDATPWIEKRKNYMILVWVLVAVVGCSLLCCVLAIYVGYEEPKKEEPKPPPKKKRLRSRIAPPPSSSESSSDDEEATVTPPRPPRRARRNDSDSDSDLRTPDYVVDHTIRRTHPRTRHVFDEAPAPLPPAYGADIVSRDASRVHYDAPATAPRPPRAPAHSPWRDHRAAYSSRRGRRFGGHGFNRDDSSGDDSTFDHAWKRSAYSPLGKARARDDFFRS